MQFAGRHGIDDYWALVRRSQDDPEWFWAAAVDYLGIEFAKPYERVLDASRGIEWATWFVGGQLNMAWNCVGRWASRTPDALAAVGETEDGEATQLTYAELWRETCRLAAGLRSLGVEPGDRVALCLPMVAEAVVALHACTLVGAVVVPIFSGLAGPAVAVRLADAEAKVVLTADGTLRRGQVFELKATIDEAVATAGCCSRSSCSSGSAGDRSHLPHATSGGRSWSTANLTAWSQRHSRASIPATSATRLAQRAGRRAPCM